SLHSAFNLLSEEDTTQCILAEDLMRHKGKKVWIKGYLIHAKRTETSNQERMFFGTFLDRKGAWLDTVHFPQVAQKHPFRGVGVYKAYGRVVVEYDCVSVEVEYMEKMAVIEDPRYAELRVEAKENKIVTWNKRRDYGKRRKSVSS
ncbi:MAG: hypothetical protein JKY09_02245, partial [Crocinitomicaceae bacterium]|nr:hypothetical protein [Crocinitomicaceae bacterium]